MEVWKRSFLRSIRARQRECVKYDESVVVVTRSFSNVHYNSYYEEANHGIISHPKVVLNQFTPIVVMGRRKLSSNSSNHNNKNHEDLQRLLEETSDRFPSVLVNRVMQMVHRHDELLQQMMDVNTNSSSNTNKNNKELATLMPVVTSCQEWMECQADYASLEELQEEAMNSNDKELQTECQMEMEELRTKIDQHIIPSLVESSLPPMMDQDDDNNAASAADGSSDAVLEIRAGTGGDEAALFASELLTAYQKCAKSQSFTWDVLSSSRTDLGGIKEASVHITASSSYGNTNNHGPYGYFQFESGVHRVQRVPVNDVRIHTSAVSVAVLPSLDDNTTNIGQLLPMAELKIETMRASGAGGQHVNTTDSAVRITHIPTGITATIQDERSQHKNKAKALKLIAARVHDVQRQEQIAKRGASRKSLLGSGDRSERIRTYNYPQDRITDHRCKQSEYGISKILSSSSENITTNENNNNNSDTTLVGIFSPMLKQLQRQQLLQQLEEEQEKNQS